LTRWKKKSLFRLFGRVPLPPCCHDPSGPMEPSGDDPEYFERSALTAV
jgi:hypothetical protein